MVWGCLLLLYSFSLSTGQPCSKDGTFINLDSYVRPSPPQPSDDWTPFASRAHFRFAEFTYKKTEMSKANTNDLIEIWEEFAERFGGGCPFRNAEDIINTIDEIDLGHVPWETFSLEYPGELPESNPPTWMTKEHRVWFRDPRQVIHSILANKDFDGEIDYSPHQIFVDGKRNFSNFMSSDWAWRQAVSVPCFALPASVNQTLGHNCRGPLNSRLHVCSNNCW